MAVDVRKKLVELLLDMPFGNSTEEAEERHASNTADYLIANGVTVQECCYKAESVISKTGLMCTACHSDIDRDAVFCKYCGAKMMSRPPKETVYCKGCENLMFSDCYGECAMGHKGIVKPTDTCKHAKRKPAKGG